MLLTLRIFLLLLCLLTTLSAVLDIGLFGGIDNFRNFITYNTAAVSGQLGAGLSAARNLLWLRYKI